MVAGLKEPGNVYVASLANIVAGGIFSDTGLFMLLASCFLLVVFVIVSMLWR